MRVKILFVCHGNICRSPMAAMVFRYLAQQRHVSGEFEVDSAALSSEEIGNGIYPPARRILVKQGCLARSIVRGRLRRRILKRRI